MVKIFGVDVSAVAENVQELDKGRGTHGYRTGNLEQTVHHPAPELWRYGKLLNSNIKCIQQVQMHAHRQVKEGLLVT